MNRKELLREGERLLREAGTENADFDAFQLILAALETDRTYFILNQFENVGENKVKKYFSFIERRNNKEPLQYILGGWDFYNSEFLVGPGVYIPRSETEELTEICIKKIIENGYAVIYDLCSGSGCIGISIAKACPAVGCYMFEYMKGALNYAFKNVALSGLSNVYIVECDVLTGNFDEKIPRPDLIVSNPPYIITNETGLLRGELLYEPISALDGGKDGLAFYRAISDIWLPGLQKNGFAAVECGENQSKDIVEIFSNHLICEIYNDIYGCERFVAGKKK